MLKSLRKFYKNNRIYCILMIISVVCIISIGTGVIVYFITQNNSSPYGTRLTGLDDYSIDKDIKEVEAFYKAQEGVKNVDLRLQGKILYISIKFDDPVTLDQMQNAAISSLEKFTPENLEFFDLQFLFTRESYPAYFGSKSSSMKTIAWANYRIDSEETTTTTTKKK